MVPISRRELLASLLALPAALPLRAQADWVPLFDGQSLHGWKAGESKSSFRVANGQIVAQGPRAYLFYTGGVRHADFKNFELRAEVMSRAGAESGIYFQTRFQQMGSPAKGFKIQLNNTCKGDSGQRELRKTGSLYGVHDVYKALANDEEWFLLQILVQGKEVQVRLNGVLLVDYVEPDPPMQEEGVPVLGRGTFALECHDPNSQVSFRNILVRPLADDLPTPTAEHPDVDSVYRGLLWMHQNNFPVVDYHIHLKQGLTLEKALKNSRWLGIGYGIPVNGGLGFAVMNDAAAEQYLRMMRGQPCFVALQGAGPDWVQMFSRETLAKFDYVFSDAMIIKYDNGKRVRIWLKEEVGEIKDKQRFMDMYVDRNLQVLNHQPIDIMASPTILPDQLMPDYDELWTPERVQAVIDAAKQNDVALEIGNRFRVPSPAIIRAAKKAGAKFSFGTDNHSATDVGRMEYVVEMVKQCGLAPQDIFVPKPNGEKPVQKRFS
jgi:histidinol phosphatase-like PHP family hydrolase